MRYQVFAVLCGLGIAGCGQAKSPPAKLNPPVERDNSGVNVRDRDDTTKTPIDQNENQSDVNTTAEIRKRIMDAKLSIDAQNVKIMTQDGKVTLRGPVKSEDEKKRIGEMATSVAGDSKVDNQIEVVPPKE